MRIRKRSVPFPFSNLSPAALPVSDVPLNKPPSEPDLEQAATANGEEQEPRGLHSGGDDLSLLNNTHLHPLYDSPNQHLRRPNVEVHHRPRPDLQLTIIRVKDGWICSDGERQEKKECCVHPNHALVVEEALKGSEEKEEEDEGEEKQIRRLKDIRKGSRFGAEATSGVRPFQVERWCEGEKAFPLKKRRGSFERKVVEETVTEKEKQMKSKLKTKTNEECGDDGVDNNTSVKKKRGSSGVGGSIMEGSRCSRVNGRGWRCCQQTLVGYSLCEHHLGKGRLRSMSSVRSRSSGIPCAMKDEDDGSLSSSLSQQQKGLEEEEEEEKPLMIMRRKRKKLGMVKARSISSLLGQTNHTAAVAAQPPPTCSS